MSKMTRVGGFNLNLLPARRKIMARYFCVPEKGGAPTPTIPG